MKNLIFKIIAISTFGISILNAYSQTKENPFFFGINAGTKQFSGEGVHEIYKLSDLHLAVGLNFGQYINRSFDWNIGLTHGMVDGHSFGKKFETKINNLSLNLKYKLANGYILKENSIIAPFVQAGFGDAVSTGSHWGKEADISFNFIYGGGLSFRLAPKHMLTLSTMHHYSMSDNYDGIDRTGASKNRKDRFVYTSVGYAYNFSFKKDNDKDGIFDKEDVCPDVFGLAQFKGCADTDGDGIEDKLDACVGEKGLTNLNGCPDSDGDGVANKDDNCPEIAGLADLLGCPDSDGDGITDSKDRCPKIKGIEKFNGCPDTDNDGIVDFEDNCPTISGALALKGCPDKDNDGVADIDDKCPDAAGIIANKGCPEVSKEVTKVLEQALKGVQFESGKDVIKKTSYSILDNVVSVMKNNPSYQLEINGHTDNQGDDTKNMVLSQNRANAVKKYLNEKGIEATRMKASGFGETIPVSDNSTAAGRSKNRRVEFKIVF